MRETFAKRSLFNKIPYGNSHPELDLLSDRSTLAKGHSLSKTSPLVFALYCLLCTASCLHASQTYIVSYRAQIKDALLISESYNCSKAMKHVEAHPSKQLTIPYSQKPNADLLLEKNKDMIVDFLMKEGLHTRSHEKVYNSKSSSRISISIPPTHITVDFNDDYAIITRLILD